jgi:hypothetical protein
MNTTLTTGRSDRFLFAAGACVMALAPAWLLLGTHVAAALISVTLVLIAFSGPTWRPEFASLLFAAAFALVAVGVNVWAVAAVMVLALIAADCVMTSAEAETLLSSPQMSAPPAPAESLFAAGRACDGVEPWTDGEDACSGSCLDPTCPTFAAGASQLTSS